MRSALPLLLILLLSACPARTGKHEGQGETTVHAKLSKPTAAASIIDGADQLVRGSRAAGSPGDVRLHNEDVVVIVGAVSSPAHGHARSGGNILDMALRDGGHDEIEQIFTYFDDTFPRQAVYTEQTVVSAGGPGEDAVLEVRGHDSELKSLAVTTRYTLAPTGRSVILETTLTNNGDEPLREFEVGDAFQWGATRHFVPGPGFELSRKRQPTLWLAGVGDKATYVATAGTTAFHTIHGGTWSDSEIATLDLEPGASGSFRREVSVAASFAEGVAQAQAIREDTVRTLRGKVQDGDGAGVEGVSVTLELAAVAAEQSLPAGRAFREGGYWLDAVSDVKGEFVVQLPPGEWTATANGGARVSAPARADLRSADGRVSLEVSAPGILLVSVTAGGKPSPHRLQIRGRKGTPSPRFGGAEAAWGKNRIASHRGSYEVPLAPGVYEVIASRGPEFEVARQTVTVSGKTPVALELERAFQTPGWVAGDFHQHAAPSSDSPTTLEDRVSSNLAEGVEILGSSDHNHITDYGPVIAKMGLSDQIAHVVGCEVTTRDVGHFNTFPLSAKPGAPAGGAFSPYGMDPKELFARMRNQRGLGENPKASGYVAPLIQVNHPRAGKIGYFDLLGVEEGGTDAKDKRMHWGFDAIEVLNGDHTDSAEKSLKDWFAMLNRGALVTAMGNSDTHSVHGDEAGLARTWVRVDTPTPANVARAVRARHAVASNGPFLTVTLGDAQLGSLVAPGAPGSTQPLRVRVQAATWVDVDTVEVIRNGVVVHAWDLPADRSPMRLDASWPVPTDTPGWYVVIARGDERMRPVYRSTPLAFTNPIWIGTAAR